MHFMSDMVILSWSCYYRKQCGQPHSHILHGNVVDCGIIVTIISGVGASKASLPAYEYFILIPQHTTLTTSFVRFLMDNGLREFNESTMIVKILFLVLSQ